jgi:hypothetical protein
MKTGLILSCLVVASCAANSGVVQTGPDTYFVSRQAATGFSGAGTLKAETIAEAGRYCVRLGRALRVIETSEAPPPYILGNFPKAEVSFACTTG